MKPLAQFLKSNLLPYQLRLVRDRSDKIVVNKSRRTGYTWTQALKLVLGSVSGRHSNIISYRFDSSKLVIDDCAFWIQELVAAGLTRKGDWQVNKSTIRYLPKSSTITALPCVPRVVRGKKGDIFIDEAAHIFLLPELMDASRPLQMWGGKVTLISSPFLPGLFSDFCESGSWSVHMTDIHRAVEEGLHQKICQIAALPHPTQEDSERWVQELISDAGKSAPQEYLCQTMSDNSGNWLSENSRFSPVQIIYPDSSLGYRYQTLEPHSIGVDVGASEAPTVISVVGAEGVLMVFEARGWMIPEVAQFVGHLITPTTRKVAIDTNGIGRGLADILVDAHGSIIEYAPNTAQWFATSCMGFLGRVWSGAVDIPNDPIILRDLGNTFLDSGKLKLRIRTDINGSRHCDSIPSLALAYQNQPPTESLIWER